MSQAGYSLLEELFGAANFSAEANDQYVRVLLMIVAGDGVVSEAEWGYLIGKANALGMPPEDIESWKKIDYTSGDLSIEAKKYWDLLGANGYDLFYDAVKMSGADGYAEEERAALRKAAEAAGIPESVVVQIEHLCELEESVRQLRISLLFPEGSVFHSQA